MSDTMTTRAGHLVQAHVGGIHLDNTPRGVELTITGSVTPSTTLTKRQATALATALVAAANG